MWCKKTTRKHKKWEEDAILIVKPPETRTLILKNMSGNVISKCCRSMKIQEIQEIDTGSALSFGGKDIEIIEELKNERDVLNKIKEEEDANEIYNQRKALEENEEKTPLPKKIIKFKPVMKGGAVPRNNKSKASSMFNADSPDAFVMPRPSPDEVYQYKLKTSKEVHVVDVVVDPHLAKVLRPHQKSGILFLYRCVMGFKVKGIKYQSFIGRVFDQIFLFAYLSCIFFLFTQYELLNKIAFILSLN